MRRRSPARRGGPRRVTTWATFDQAITIATGNYQTLNLLSDFTADGGSTQGVTVLRTHLKLVVTSGVAAADSMHFGIIRGQNTDVGANVAGAPTPNADHYEDWAFWQHYTAGNVVGAGPSYSHMGSTNVLLLDLRAKRKIPELQMSYNAVIEATTVAATLLVTMSARTLLALP